MSETEPRDPRVLVRSEQSQGRLGIIEGRMPAGAAGPPLHTHDFDEAFYVLDGELTVQLEDQLLTLPAGTLAFAPGGVPHTLANHSDSPTLFLMTCTPAGFEREFARRAARAEGVDPPEWAQQEIPPVTVVGPQISRER